MPRILITGASGFIGRNLIQHLGTIEGYQIIPVSLEDGYDLAQPGWVKQLPGDGVDIVLHLAQSLQYRQFPTGSGNMFAVNTASTHALAEWARTNGVQRFIYASTGNVYKPGTQLCDETSECQPVGMYASTKLAAELLLRPYASLFETIILRPFGVYGPGQTAMLVYDMIQRIRQGQEVRLAGGVGIYLTPLYIQDAVEIIHQLLHLPQPERWMLYNLAGEQVLGLNEICAQIAAGLSLPLRTQVTQDPPAYLCGANQRTKAFHPQFISFEHGLQRTLASLSTPT